MRRICIFFVEVFLNTAVILTLIMPFAQGQEVSRGGPLPPPVNIVTAVENVPGTEEVIVTIKVTPLEDMHLDIKCLLPQGLEAIREPGIPVMPYMDRYSYPRDLEKRDKYREAVELYVGPLTGNMEKIFKFHINRKDNQEQYECLIRLDALAKWGVKEEVFKLCRD